MQTDLILSLSAFCGVALAVTFTTLLMVISRMQSETKGDRLYIRQLIDRIAIHEYAKGDPLIPRIFTQNPPSVKEEEVAGPHGRAFNEVFQERQEAQKLKAAGVTKTFKLDLAEEFKQK